MGSVNLNSIVLSQLSRIETVGGDVLHGIKKTDNGYYGFGEAYFSWIFAGHIKAWKRHNLMTMNLIVPFGNVRFVFCVQNKEENNNNEYRVEEIGENRFMRITVPPGIWFGFQSLSPKSLVLNVSDIVHKSTEVDRVSISHFHYTWS